MYAEKKNSKGERGKTRHSRLYVLQRKPKEKNPKSERDKTQHSWSYYTEKTQREKIQRASEARRGIAEFRSTGCAQACFVMSTKHRIPDASSLSTNQGFAARLSQLYMQCSLHAKPWRRPSTNWTVLFVFACWRSVCVLTEHTDSLGFDQHWPESPGAGWLVRGMRGGQMDNVCSV